MSDAGIRGLQERARDHWASSGESGSAVSISQTRWRRSPREYPQITVSSAVEGMGERIYDFIESGIRPRFPTKDLCDSSVRVREATDGLQAVEAR